MIAGHIHDAFNRRHELSGHLFAGRYKSLLQSIVFGVDLAGWEKQPHRGRNVYS
jgi:hypothetical protein